MRTRHARRAAVAGRGFALVELIAVLAIMAILAGAMAPLLLSNIDRAEKDREQQALEAIAEGIRAYYLDESSPANYGRLPPDATWNTDLTAGNYVAGSAADILTNNRDVARFYVSNAADITMDPMVTLASHIAVGGTAIPASFAATCVGAAHVNRDPCSNPEVTPYAMDLLATDMRVVNLNLAPERRRIIERVREEFLEPVVALIELLPLQECRGVVDGDYPITGLAIPVSVRNTARPNDVWGFDLRLSKNGAQWTVRSTGPGGADPVGNPLTATALCTTQDDLAADFQRVSDAILGAADAVSPRILPTVVEYAALTVDKSDPWGNDLVYALDALAGNGFTLTSNGPDGGAGGGDDIPFTMDANTVVGHFARLGIHFPGPDESDCAGAEDVLTSSCGTVIEYLLHAAECNNNAVLHRDLGCPPSSP